MRVQATTLSGFGLLFSVSFRGGHGVLLLTGVFAMHGKKETMSPKELDFKHFHGLHTVSLPRWLPWQRYAKVSHDKTRDPLHGRTE